MKLARIILISKDEDSPYYPEEGKVRTIAVLPAITKLYEICLHQHIEEHIQDKEILHPNQRGFRPKKSCRDNIIDLIHAIKAAKEEERGYRR